MPTSVPPPPAPPSRPPGAPPAWPRPVVTQLLVALNVAVYGTDLLLSEAIQPPASGLPPLAAWGANAGLLTAADDQWWRLVTSAFLHGSPLHLGVNMLSLLSLGRVCEAVFSRGSYLLVYFASAVFGGLGSILWRPDVVSVGSSTALFGLLGAYGVLLWRARAPEEPRALRRMRWTLVAMVAFNLWLGVALPMIDNAGHVGGLVGGALTTALLVGSRALPVRRRLARSGAFLAVLAAVVAGVARERVAASPRVAAHGLLVEAERALRGDRLGEALRLVDEAVALDPARAEAYLLRATLRLGAGERDGASTDAARAAALAPRDADVHRAAARIALAAGDVDAARASLARAEELAPGAGDLATDRALLEWRSGDEAAALAAAGRAIERAPRDAEAWNLRAWLLVLAGRPAEALPDADRAVALDAASPYALGTRCWARVGTGDLAGARTDCARAVALDADLHADAGMLRWIEGDAAGAAALWERWVAEHPEDAADLAPWLERARAAAAAPAA